MRPDLDAARDVARRAVELTGADEAEALVMAADTALSRFANGHIHQNVAESDAQVSVRAVLGTRIGVASTNRLDDDSLRACCERAVASARVAPEDPDFPGLPASSGPRAEDRGDASTSSFGAPERAAAVAQLVSPSADRGFTAAGKVEVSDYAIAIANSKGIDAGCTVTDAKATVLSMSPRGGSGWGAFAGRAASMLQPARLGEEAASLAQRSEQPGELSPGDYTVVLGPEAVGDLLAYLSYTGFSAKAVAEGSSFMTGHLGERLMSEIVTIYDDASSSDAVGPSFDYEGVPKTRTPIVESGVVVGPVTDSYWASRTGRPNTGHALPAPNSFGPLPLNLVMAGGDASSLDDLIASVDRGVYVTRFHYLNIEDPVRAVLTGMTRDGTFLIENGSLGRPVKNLRFTQSAVEALDRVRGVTSERRLVGDEGNPSLVPALLVEAFRFTGQTS